MPRVHVRAKPDRKILQLYYVDPLSGRDVTRSAKTADWKEAERAAANWEAELEAGVLARTLSWEIFRKRFEAEYFPQCASATAVAIGTAMNHLESVLGKPKQISMLDAQAINRLSAGLRSAGMGATTLAKQLRHIRLMLNWAAKVGYLKVAPKFLMPRDASTSSKGRALTEAEYKAMLDKAEPSWRRLIEGLWLSGMRLEEAIRLSWDEPPVQLDMQAGRHPRIIFSPAGHKNRKMVVSPITPDFAAFLATGPQTGLVFPVGVSSSRASHVICEIGEAVGIKVAADKFASAHDLRRSFATRWALRVPPIALKALMRHRSLGTTLAYYINSDVSDVADLIWGHSVPPPVPSPDETKPKKPQKRRGK